jgi:hypothetical protein
MGNIIELPAPNHFGDCPKCRQNDGHLNIGRDHWFYCRQHRVKWRAGSELFPDWLQESEQIWEQNQALLDFFMEVEPFQQSEFPVDEEAFFREYRSIREVSGHCLHAFSIARRTAEKK